MGTFSFNGTADSRAVSLYLSPKQLNTFASNDMVATTVRDSDHYQLMNKDGSATLDLYGNGFTYNADSITGGTFTSESLDQNGLRTFTASGFSLGYDQLNAYSSYEDASTLVFGGNDAISASLSATNNDTLLGYTGDDTIQGGPGSDLILGNQGADVILSNQDNDEIYGGKDNDVVFAGKGDDKVTGNEGDDAIAGNEGNDTLHGGQGNDIVYGGQDQDLIYGDIGNDTLYGNQGADLFRFAQGDGADLIADFSKSDGDKIDLQGLGYNVTQNAQGNAVVNVFGGGTIELAGIKAAAVDGSYFSG